MTENYTVDVKVFRNICKLVGVKFDIKDLTTSFKKVAKKIESLYDKSPELFGEGQKFESIVEWYDPIPEDVFKGIDSGNIEVVDQEVVEEHEEEEQGEQEEIEEKPKKKPAAKKPAAKVTKKKEKKTTTIKAKGKLASKAAKIKEAAKERSKVRAKEKKVVKTPERLQEDTAINAIFEIISSNPGVTMEGIVSGMADLGYKGHKAKSTKFIWDNIYRLKHVYGMVESAGRGMYKAKE